ncbi:MAG TPA: deoxyribose-phosphate aldolase [Bacilli bacterium]|nr:deoxyribose-phosphate aldolase [Bacilli bacterium]
MKKEELARFIDQTILKPGVTYDFIRKFAQDAKESNFASVCILPSLVSVVSKELKGSDTKVCTVISFPLGMDTPDVKIAETREAINLGAEEIDLVLNVCALKSEDYQTVDEELSGVVKLCHDRDVLVKLIIETPLLTQEQIIKACELSEKHQVDIVKTSTGFSAMLPRSTTVEDVKLIKENIKSETGIKAAGGIRTTEDALEMIKAGATRIGASSGQEIISNY